MSKLKLFCVVPMASRDAADIGADMATALKNAGNDRYELVASLFDMNESPRQCIAKAINLMLNEADVVYVMPGWENARGCVAEVRLALDYGKPILFDQEAMFPQQGFRFCDDLRRRKNQNRYMGQMITGADIADFPHLED